MTTDYRYTGQREEAGIGLYFYNARWYDPALGRFISADTLTPGSGGMAWERYAYVRDNPMRFTDPSGYDVGCPASNPACLDSSAATAKSRAQYSEVILRDKLKHGDQYLQAIWTGLLREAVENGGLEIPANLFAAMGGGDSSDPTMLFMKLASRPSTTTANFQLGSKAIGRGLLVIGYGAQLWPAQLANLQSGTDEFYDYATDMVLDTLIYSVSVSVGEAVVGVGELVIGETGVGALVPPLVGAGASIATSAVLNSMLDESNLRPWIVEYLVSSSKIPQQWTPRVWQPAYLGP